MGGMRSQHVSKVWTGRNLQRFEGKAPEGSGFRHCAHVLDIGKYQNINITLTVSSRNFYAFLVFE